MDKIALITGVTGQDGSYLAELLLEKGYIVHGIKRHSSSLNTDRVNHLYQEPHSHGRRFILHYGDVTDSTNLTRLVQSIRPTEIYHLAAQSHVRVSFDMAEYTANVDAIGSLRILESICLLGLKDRIRFYQASSSEMYGNSSTAPQNEDTPFAPVSPYAAAKLCAYWSAINYRKAYGLYACNGILFNHESPRRGEIFITKKITQAAAMIHKGRQDCLYVGNLEAQRDWGHARDYVYGMWLMLQQPEPDDYVLATGRKESVRWFIEKTFGMAGMDIEWKGSHTSEVGVDARTGKTMIRIDPQYFRPNELNALVGDYGKAKRKLRWEPKIKLEEMIEEMLRSDIAAIESGKA